uniref:(northern house mosquito) hypothetical protein n=1 Tax=Culex pipiens TaxID=7175 RepID=A0A8D8GK40_CULPI
MPRSGPSRIWWPVWPPRMPTSRTMVGTTVATTATRATTLNTITITRHRTFRRCMAIFTRSNVTRPTRTVTTVTINRCLHRPHRHRRRRPPIRVTCSSSHPRLMSATEMPISH